MDPLLDKIAPSETFCFFYFVKSLRLVYLDLKHTLTMFQGKSVDQSQLLLVNSVEVSQLNTFPTVFRLKLLTTISSFYTGINPFLVIWVGWAFFVFYWEEPSFEWFGWQDCWILINIFNRIGGKVSCWESLTKSTVINCLNQVWSVTQMAAIKSD